MKKTYCCSDLHGVYELWTAIKNYCKEEDTIVFLGDACDRGKDGLKIIKELLEDKRVIYLKGNHEDMLYKVGLYIVSDSYNFYNYSNYLENGGLDTLKDFYMLSREEQKKLLLKINNLPYYALYKNKDNNIIALSHSGYIPHNMNEEDKEKMLWDRRHITEKEWNKNYKAIVHGHTPVQTINPNKNKILKYCNEYKIDIDLGSYASNIAALLDLDTLEPIYFKI